MSTHSSRMSLPASHAIDRWEAAGLVGVALLLVALVSPVVLQTLLVPAGLLGVAGLRFSAARSGWARRGLVRA